MAWILVLLGVALVAWAVFAFNRLVRLRNQWRTAWADIDVQLQRRHDLVPQLVASVQGYARHESALLEAVTALRSQALTLSGPKQLGEIEDALEQGLGRLLALGEAYPDLKASANFQELQGELADLEDKLAAARRALNAAVSRFNAAIQSFPAVLFAGALGFKEADFNRLDDSEKGVVDQVPNVQF